MSSQARTAYKALAVGVIRRGPELTSAKVATLEVGQAVEALEKRTLKDGTVRLRLKAGWVSKVAKVRPTVSCVDNYNDMPVNLAELRALRALRRAASRYSSMSRPNRQQWHQLQQQ